MELVFGILLGLVAGATGGVLAGRRRGSRDPELVSRARRVYARLDSIDQEITEYMPQVGDVGGVPPSQYMDDWLAFLRGDTQALPEYVAEALFRSAMVVLRRALGEGADDPLVQQVFERAIDTLVQDGLDMTSSTNHMFVEFQTTLWVLEQLGFDGD